MMRHRWWLLGLSAVLLPGLAGAAAAPSSATGRSATAVTLSPCAVSDNGFPDLQSLTLSPSTLDVRRRAAWLTITARATDDGGPGPATGVRSVEVTLTPGLNRGLIAELAPQPDGSWQARVLVPPGTRPGTHSLQYALLRDRTGFTGNVRGYSAADLRAMGQSVDVDVQSRRDRQGPRLESLSLSRTSVDLTRRAQAIRVRARVTDAIAGTDTVQVQTDAGYSDLRLRHGTRRDGIWSGTLRVRRWAPTDGSPYMIFVNLRDRTGTDRLVYFDELADRGFPSMLTVTSSRRDTADPRLRRVRAEPTTVDVTAGDAQVEVALRATDALSGVGRASVWSKPLRRTSGTLHDGTWSRSLLIDSCTMRSGTVRPQVVAFDRAENRVTARPVINVVNDKDIKVPGVRSIEPGEVTPVQPVTVTFTEDVTGISSTSAPVRRTQPGMGFGTDDPPPAEAGVWSCAATAGAPVDCGTGVVRTATWTPSVPLTRGQTYGVDLNPEHVLDVVDLVGNPIDRALRFEDEFAPTWTVTP